jgi:hypothetical protein
MATVFSERSGEQQGTAMESQVYCEVSVIKSKGLGMLTYGAVFINDN